MPLGLVDLTRSIAKRWVKEPAQDYKGFGEFKQIKESVDGSFSNIEISLNVS